MLRSFINDAVRHRTMGRSFVPYLRHGGIVFVRAMPQPSHGECAAVHVPVPHGSPRCSYAMLVWRGVRG
ncbi:MAG: hypothetical protein Q4E55_00265 [Bacteroidales bacterium]|nr:hypothetical protein [Bacteroidales bacterium]